MPAQILTFETFPGGGVDKTEIAIECFSRTFKTNIFLDSKNSGNIQCLFLALFIQKEFEKSIVS